MSPIPPPPPATHHQIELFFTLQELKKISISVFLNEKKNELNPSRPRRPWNERMSERESEVARENSMSCKRQPYTNTHRHREVAPREQ